MKYYYVIIITNTHKTPRQYPPYESSRVSQNPPTSLPGLYLNKYDQLGDISKFPPLL